MKPSRTDQTLVGDILKQVADTLAVVSSSDGLREHHTHVYHLEQSIIINQQQMQYLHSCNCIE